MSSPRMICSVKFLHPTTMRGRREQEGSTANVNKMMMSAAAGRARLSAAQIINLRNLTARLNVVPSRFEQLRGLPRSTLMGFCMLRGSLWRKPFFQPAQQGIGGQRHQGGGNCARENYIVVDHGESAKNHLPSLPAPIAAAIVAKPTEITTATRTPARMTLAARGSSTLNRSCQSVRPMPRAA